MPAPDPIAQLRAAIASSPIPLSKLAQIAEAETHIAHATGTLLQQRGAITGADIALQVKAVSDAGKVDKEAVAQAVSKLPSVSDQDALRSALVTQRAQSIRNLVALHGAMQDRRAGAPNLARAH